MKVHKSITADRLIGAANRRDLTLDNPGICIACGEDAEGCEPDARGYTCEVCDKNAVYGAEELLLMGAYHPD